MPSTVFFGGPSALHAFFWRAFGPPRFFLEGRQPSTLFFGGSPALHDFFLAGRQAKMAFFSTFLLYNSHFRCNMMFSHGLFFFYCIFAPLRGVFRGGPSALHDFFGGSPTLQKFLDDFFSALHDFFWRAFGPPRSLEGFLEEKKPSYRGGGTSMSHTTRLSVSMFHSLNQFFFTARISRGNRAVSVPYQGNHLLTNPLFSTAEGRKFFAEGENQREI